MGSLHLHFSRFCVCFFWSPSVVLFNCGFVMSKDISEDTKKFLNMVAKFITCKNDLQSVAARVLPMGYMDTFPSFKDESKMRQVNNLGKTAANLDEIYDVASNVAPVFSAILSEIVTEAGLSPGEKVFVDGKLLDINDIPVTVLTVAPLKSKGRALEKVFNEYKGDFSQIVDIVRASIVVNSEAALIQVASSLTKANKHYSCVRLKNRFKEPLFNGYRDALYSIVMIVNGTTHVCEVQLHLAPIIALKEKSHVCYEFFRSYFRGNVDAVEVQMKTLEAIGSFHGDIEGLLLNIGSSNNVEELQSFAQLVGKEMMGEYRLEIALRERLLQITEAGKKQEDKDNMQALLKAKYHLGMAYHHYKSNAKAKEILEPTMLSQQALLGIACEDTLLTMDAFGFQLYNDEPQKAEPILRTCLAEWRKMRGDIHVDTLETICNYALCLKSLGRIQEALPLYDEALRGRRQLFGPKHPLVCQSLQNSASLYVMLKQYDKAEVNYKLALPMRMELQGMNHPSTLNCMFGYANLLKTLHRYDEALDLYTQAEAGARKSLGELHVSTAKYRHSIEECSKALERRQKTQTQTQAPAIQAVDTPPSAQPSSRSPPTEPLRAPATEQLATPSSSKVGADGCSAACVIL